MSELSINSKIIILINKIDKLKKLSQKEQDNIITKGKNLFQSKAGNFKIECFPTSIWEISIYKVWSNLLGNVIPNKDKINYLLDKYCQACQADEVILFERNTFLFISSSKNKNNKIKEDERFEKFGEEMKKFKNFCQKSSKQFHHFLINNIKNMIYLDEFTNSTCIMTVLSNKSVSLELLKINIEISKKNFIEIMGN